MHAILTVCQAWLIAGRPLGTRTLGSYEAWAEVIGGILVEFAGIRGFLENRSATEQALDVEEAAWEELFEQWVRQFGVRAVGVSDIFAMLQRLPNLLAALNLGDRGVLSQKTQLGLKLQQRRDRVTRGRRLVLADKVHGANHWQLVPV